MKRWVIAVLMAAMVPAGCAGPGGDPAVTAPASAAPAALLADHGLTGKDTVQVIDHLDRVALAERAADLKASVRPYELLLSRGAQQVSLALPADRFYLSVAPYVNRTHDCFHHSLTTCKGELAGQEIRVTVVDDTHDRVLVDEVRTTFANGFTGFWLPRDIDGTLRVTYGGKSGETAISTAAKAPTCLTTLRLT